MGDRLGESAAKEQECHGFSDTAGSIEQYAAWHCLAGAHALLCLYEREHSRLKHLVDVALCCKTSLSNCKLQNYHLCVATMCQVPPNHNMGTTPLVLLSDAHLSISFPVALPHTHLHINVIKTRMGLSSANPLPASACGVVAGGVGW